jgi:uncharacterized protein YjbJ (UPF0337 family)
MTDVGVGLSAEINHHSPEHHMNTLSIKGNWKKFIGRIKQQFANLKGDDLLFKEGKDQESLGKLQEKIGKTNVELRKLVGKL